MSKALDILVSNFNPIFQGVNWSAILSAVAVGDDFNFTNAEYVFSQMFMATASGTYLVERASDYGISYPSNVGMNDNLFRQYAISNYVDKVTTNGLEEILEVFFGDVATRASSLSSTFEPYQISGGQSLLIEIDGQQNIIINFISNDFVTDGLALAEEVAFAITRACAINNSNAFAVSQYDPVSGKNGVRIFSGSLGLGGSVQILGGQARFLTVPDYSL